MKKIITHINPDMDAVASAWILSRFLPGWEKAKIGFVRANSKELEKVDQNSDVWFVDIGLGKLDHHQLEERTSAAQQCLNFVLRERENQPLARLDKAALEEIVAVVTEVDNAVDLQWPEITSPRLDFYLYQMLSGVKTVGLTDEKAMAFGLTGLDAVFQMVKKRLHAVGELKNGEEFETVWGKSLAIETDNDAVIKEGEKAGYSVVVRKDTRTGGVRIYARPDRRVDLTSVYQKVKELDPESDWFLHSSKALLLNMTSISEMRPTKLALKELIAIFPKKS